MLRIQVDRETNRKLQRQIVIEGGLGRGFSRDSFPMEGLARAQRFVIVSSAVVA